MDDLISLRKFAALLSEDDPNTHVVRVRAAILLLGGAVLDADDVFPSLEDPREDINMGEIRTLAERLNAISRNLSPELAIQAKELARKTRAVLKG